MINEKELEEQGDVNVTYQKWDNVGDKVAGVLVDKKKNDVLDQYGHKKIEYILIKEDGEKVCVSGRAYPRGANKVGKDYRIIFGMQDIPLGAEIMFVFESTMSNDKGNDTKIISPKYVGNRDLEVLKVYQDKWGTTTTEDEQSEEPSVTEVTTEDSPAKVDETDPLADDEEDDLPDFTEK